MTLEYQTNLRRNNTTLKATGKHAVLVMNFNRVPKSQRPKPYLMGNGNKTSGFKQVRTSKHRGQRLDKTGGAFGGTRLQGKLAHVQAAFGATNPSDLFKLSHKAVASLAGHVKPLY